MLTVNQGLASKCYRLIQNIEPVCVCHIDVIEQGGGVSLDTLDI